MEQGLPIQKKCDGGAEPCCISCHVIIQQDFVNKLIQTTNDEDFMLEQVANPNIKYLFIIFNFKVQEWLVKSLLKKNLME
jgi:ferredoxin